jgi:hypothetical protein
MTSALGVEQFRGVSTCLPVISPTCIGKKGAKVKMVKGFSEDEGEQRRLCIATGMVGWFIHVENRSVSV